jgi:hypothetical protein
MGREELAWASMRKKSRTQTEMRNAAALWKLEIKRNPVFPTPQDLSPCAAIERKANFLFGEVSRQK